jgi:hypothetical protein
MWAQIPHCGPHKSKGRSEPTLLKMRQVIRELAPIRRRLQAADRDKQRKGQNSRGEQHGLYREGNDLTEPLRALGQAAFLDVWVRVSISLEKVSLGKGVRNRFWTHHPPTGGRTRSRPVMVSMARPVESRIAVEADSTFAS